jgi:nicotinamidase-related amidase
MQNLTSDNVAVLFLDLQDGTVSGVKTVGRHKLRRTTAALAKLAVLHGLPAFLSTIPPAGNVLKGVLEALGDRPLHPRTVTTAFGDPAFVAAVKEAGRPVLLIAGVASEIVVLRTALDAVAAGYEVHIAIDACGGFAERTEAAAWSRATIAGVTMSSVVTAAAELAGDFTSEAGAKTLELIYEAAGK